MFVRMGKMKNKMMESSDDEEFNTFLSSHGKRKSSVKTTPPPMSTAKRRKMNSGNLSVGKKRLNVHSASPKSPLRKQMRNVGSSRLEVPKVSFRFPDIVPTGNWNLKIWDPYFQRSDYWAATAYISSDIYALSKIKRNLSETQLNMFKSTCFGRFLELSEIKVQPHLIHCLLMRELHQPDSSCLFIEVGGQRLRFGKEEFSMICGLKCLENKVILNGQGTPDNKIVADTDFDLVETGYYSEYFWGTHVFNLTMRSLKKNAQNQNRPGYYRLYGCPVLFQIWFYEVCGFAKGFLCQKTRSGTPRMFNWRTLDSTVNKEILERNLFSKSPEQLNCKNMVPDKEEVKILETYNMWLVPYESAEYTPIEEGASMNEDNSTSFEESARPSQNSSERNEGHRTSEHPSEGSKVLREVAALRTYMESSFEKVFKMLADINKRFDEEEKLRFDGGGENR
ncbi:uncharacterized protein [Euphorbia lathyris]|uniref:uncharacterized protein n=1 Tax=Euphorbia lathyris TaxID=212925 RepID=UPI003313238D